MNMEIFREDFFVALGAAAASRAGLPLQDL